MEVTINLPDDLVKQLEDHVGFYNVNNTIDNIEANATIEDVIKGALVMYLKWVGLDSTLWIDSKDLVIESRMVEIFKAQERRQKEIIEKTGIPKSTISTLWNGTVPSLETFIKLWIELGEPPLQQLLTIHRK
jgi:predicted XRE-type DNA-binding protein